MPFNLNILREQIIGNDKFFNTPYGKRLITYADYIASGRTLKFIEKYLINIQRSYANTHTEDDYSGSYMTKLLHEAEKSIKRNINAEDNCYLIPFGTGATGAIAKLSQILGIYMSPFTLKRLNEIITKVNDNDGINKESIDKILKFISDNKPVVFIAPYEHHSNELMWREGIAEVVEIDLSNDGTFNLEDMKRKVSDPKYKNRLKIGSFSAASNVTGIKTPVYKIAEILHENNAYACFDFAASAPYAEINMNKDDKCFFDAIFISPHKFLGGPGSSGLLIINKRIYNNKLSPSYAGGGTVDYVSSYGYDFVKDVENREKAGTPGILQIIKAAIVFQLKEEIGVEEIEKKELHYTEKAFERLSDCENIKILGPKVVNKRIGVFSFIIRHRDKYLHPRLVTRLLNDLFGIQSRAGCDCAGPYGHRLLGIDKETSEKYRDLTKIGINCLKPGWVRVNFHYTLSEDEFDYICGAIEFIAEHGYLFLSEYMVDYMSGIWTHKDIKENLNPIDFNIKNLFNNMNEPVFTNKRINRRQEFLKYIQEAFIIVEVLRANHEDNYLIFKDKRLRELTWFYHKLKDDRSNK